MNDDPRCGEFDSLHDDVLSDLYRETRAVAPPEHLDRHILAAAGVGLPKRRSARRWTLPLALAATVTLAIGLIRVLPPAGEMSKAPAEEGKMMRARSESAITSDAPAADLSERADRETSAAAQPAAPALEALPNTSQQAPAAIKAPSPSWGAPMPSLMSPPIERDAAKVPSRRKAGLRPAAEWLANIAELRRQGRTAEAEAEAAEFRRHYPHLSPNAVAKPPH